MPVHCHNKCSSEEKITREKMKEHLEVCPDQEVSCKYSKFGCDIKVKQLVIQINAPLPENHCKATSDCRPGITILIDLSFLLMPALLESNLKNLVCHEEHLIYACLHKANCHALYGHGILKGGLR